MTTSQGRRRPLDASSHGLRSSAACAAVRADVDDRKKSESNCEYQFWQDRALPTSTHPWRPYPKGGHGHGHGDFELKSAAWILRCSSGQATKCNATAGHKYSPTTADSKRYRLALLQPSTRQS